LFKRIDDLYRRVEQASQLLRLAQGQARSGLNSPATVPADAEGKDR
jgi:hypothetical protein